MRFAKTTMNPVFFALLLRLIDVPIDREADSCVEFSTWRGRMCPAALAREEAMVGTIASVTASGIYACAKCGDRMPIANGAAVGETRRLTHL